jgi:hypothetical protein
MPLQPDPRRGSARAAFSEHTRGRDADAREYARAGLDWDSLNPTRQVAMLKGGAKASRKAKAHDLGDLAAGRRGGSPRSAGGMPACWGKRRRRSAAGDERMAHACEVARAVGQAAAAARRGGRGRGAGRMGFEATEHGRT